jgi:hypothetical protein
MGKKAIEAVGLKEALDMMKALAYMREFRVMPLWNEDRGLMFRLLRQLYL